LALSAVSGGKVKRMGLLERAVSSATAAYRSVLLLPHDTLGLVLRVYFDGDATSQLTPPPMTVPQAKLDWCAANGRIDDLWEAWDPPEVLSEELRDPDVRDNAELLALLAAINDGGYEAGLLEDYLAALALSLHESLGVLVVVEGLDESFGAPLREQLRPQMSEEQWAEWEANDWLPRNRAPDRLLASLDVVVATRIDPDRVAAVYLRDGALFADAWLSSTKFSTELTRPVQLVGEDPAVLAGLMPDGVVSVRVQDLYDSWHAGLVGRGAWLCVLPHAARGPLPEVDFRDAAGQPVAPAPVSETASESFTVELVADPSADAAAWLGAEQQRERQVLENAASLLLWPPDAGIPTLSGWSNDGSGVELENDEVMVAVDATDLFADLSELLEERLRTWLGDQRLAARIVTDAVRSKLPARVRGRNTSFDAIAGGGAWAALRDPTIAVSGLGPIPERLVLDRIGPDDVQSSYSE
jgi:hypothetical protein